MSPGIAVELIVGIFFLIGIAVGVIAVIALSAIRKDKGRPPGGGAAPAQDGPGEPDEPPDLAWDDADDRPRWPGSAGGGFSRR
jgi:hypothetical protein